MSYLLPLTGPDSFERSVAPKPGGPAVVVGRDPEAAVYLPDAERLVSRRHLSIEWCEGGASVRVLSANGIGSDQGDYFSGDLVVLGHGESARIGSYTMTVVAASAADDATSFAGMGTRPIPVDQDTRSAPLAEAGEPDPWAQLVAEWSPAAQASPAQAPPGGQASTGTHEPSVAPSDRATPAPAPATPATALPSDDRVALHALCRGLGVDPSQVPAGFDWERFGRSVREVVQRLADQLAGRAACGSCRPDDDPAAAGTQKADPLAGGTPVEALLRDLLVQPDGTNGRLPAPRGPQRTG